MVSPKITKRSSTIIRGPQMECGALRRLSGSLTTLLWDLCDRPYTAMIGPNNALSWAPTQPWARGRLAPVIPSPPLISPGWGSCSVSFVFLAFSWDDLFYSIRAKNAILVKSCQFYSAFRSKMSSDCTPGIA